MKRKNHLILFAILLLSLTSLSPSLDFTQKDLRRTNNTSLNPMDLDSPNLDDDRSPMHISVQMSQSDFKSLEGMNQRFNQETGIKTVLTNYTEEIGSEEISRLLAIGEGPDILLMKSEWVKGFATKGYLLPVESYLKSTSGSDTLRLLLPTVEWNGYHWATPYDMNPYVLIWQQDILATMGMDEVPTTNKEWMDFLSKQGSREEQILLGLDANDPHALATFMAGFGSDLLHPDEETLQWLEQTLPYIYVKNKETQDDGKLIEEHGMPLYLVPYSDMAEPKYDGLKVKIPEDFYNQAPVFLRSTSIAVTSQTILSDQAAEWIDYMISTYNQQQWLETTKRLPALRTIYEKEPSHIQYIPYGLQWLQEPKRFKEELDLKVSPSWEALTIAVKQLLTGQIDMDEFKKLYR
ncbi:extracellular solute-binding protein [Paenibacillus sp. CMAA1364]